MAGLRLGLGLGLAAAIAASPYAAEINQGAQLITDFAGSKDGQPYYWYRGTRYTSPDKIPGWSFSRASAGYAETKDGRLVAFGPNEPRITDRGLLGEGAATNLVPRSQQFDDSGWSKSNVSVAADVVAAPDGTLTADALARSAVSTASYAIRAVPGAPAVGSSLTFSLFAKAKSISGRVGLRILGTYPDRVDAVFNLNTGTVRGVQSSGGWSGAAASILPMADGWFRLILAGVSGNSPVGSVIFGPTDDSLTNSAWESGSSVLSDLYTWGAQIEVGSSATSYIRTDGAAATRAADSAYINGLAGMLGQFRTNYLPNSTWQGGVVGGALPTGMGASARGLNVLPAGFGTDADGSPYMDLRINGTVTSAGNLDIQLAVAAGAPNASVGQTWNTSTLVGMVAGVQPPNGATWSVWEATATGSWLSSSGTSLIGAWPARVQATKTFSNASVAKAMAALQLASLTVGQVVDVTYRISQPMLELGSQRSEFVPTSNGPATIGNPFTLVSWDGGSGGGAFPYNARLSNDTNTAGIGVFRAGANGLVYINQTGASDRNLTALGGAGARKTAFRSRASGLRGAVDGALSNDWPSDLPQVGLARLHIGAGFGTTNPLNGYIQRIMIMGDVTDAQLQGLAA